MSLVTVSADNGVITLDDDHSEVITSIGEEMVTIEVNAYEGLAALMDPIVVEMDREVYKAYLLACLSEMMD